MFKKRSLFLSLAIFLLSGSQVGFAAGWEAGAKISYDSNVNRSIDDGKGSSFLTAYASYHWLPSGESRINWIFSAVLEGSAYANWKELNQLQGSIAPGIMVFLNPVLDFNLSPFFQFKEVSDSDQSLLAYGIKATLRQKWNRSFYSGEYYSFTSSNAGEDVYSYRENALGIFAGMNWTSSLFTEIGYEYAHGDSFMTYSTITSVPEERRGLGRGRGDGMHSTAYDAFVIKGTVDRSTVAVNVGVNLTSSVFSVLSCAYVKENGDLGSVESRSCFIGLGYKF